MDTNNLDTHTYLLVSNYQFIFTIILVCLQSTNVDLSVHIGYYFLMMWFSLFMIMFCILYSNLETML